MEETTDTSMIDPIQPQTKPKKRKKHSQSHETTTTTIKSQAFSYIYLTLISSSPIHTASNIDILTLRTHLTSALTQFLGITGSAIPIDILKNEARDLWIRVPREDCSAVIAAVGGWTGEGGEVGWRVRGSSNWLGSLVGQQGIQKIWGN